MVFAVAAVCSLLFVVALFTFSLVSTQIAIIFSIIAFGLFLFLVSHDKPLRISMVFWDWLTLGPVIVFIVGIYIIAIKLAMAVWYFIHYFLAKTALI